MVKSNKLLNQFGTELHICMQIIDAAMAQVAKYFFA